MEDRARWVDYAKGIGIILVVYGHVMRGLYSAGFEFYGRFYELSDSIVYSFHMPLFFFLSGLFFYQTLSNKGPKQLIFSKIDTLFYPYVVWSIFQGSIEAILSNYTNGNVTFSDVLSLLWAPRAQFWFLYDLFFCFVFFSVILNAQTKIRTIISFLFLITFYYILLNVSNDNTLLLVYCIFFLFGVIYNFYFNKGYMESKLLLLIVSILFFISQYIYHFYYSLSYLDYSIFSLLLAFVSVFFIVLLSLFLSKTKVKFLSYLGGASMAIYLMHILAGSGVRVILGNIFGIESVVIHLILGLVAGLFFPLIALWVFRKANLKYIFSAPISGFLTDSNKTKIS
ncbi:acyltransferase family protein [Shewanella sp. SG41-3]|uniref:acyltransferase family protein n=1 Tax=Shewanella sp. SG41-3 TaxID=2760977 RepID=UPI001600CF3A|nr:acyltransferase [Shewanella sp. SG41-3]MBB1477107.1 acyltransferase [Shewanella sp. SG41-3]|tara:strand:- start:527 stop:1546 length:1020 start_codon:yes stop_codon:yes gene_type:complete